MLVFSFNIVSLYSLCRYIHAAHRQSLVPITDGRLPTPDGCAVRAEARSQRAVTCSAAQCSAVQHSADPIAQWLGRLVTGYCRLVDINGRFRVLPRVLLSRTQIVWQQG